MFRLKSVYADYHVSFWGDERIHTFNKRTSPKHQKDMFDKSHAKSFA